jgi:hypothetical protein
VTTLLTVPSPPRFLLDRLKFLENHIVRLEKEYPPWAALHFNQPNRGVSSLIYTFQSFLYLRTATVAPTTTVDSRHRSGAHAIAN